MFTEHNKNITYVGNIQGKNTVQDKDQVVLRIDDESVLIKDVKKLGASSFNGTVMGFEPSFTEEFNGIKIGDKVSFESKHIVSCS